MPKFKKGDVVQPKANWGQPPTQVNTMKVTRAAANGSWVDVSGEFARKRIPNPEQHLRKVKT